MQKFKNILIGFVLFFFIYLEPIYIGPVKWGQIWKGLFCVFAILYVILKKVKAPKFIYIYYFITFLSLINTSIFSYPIETISVTLKILLFPLTYHFFLSLNLQRSKYFSMLRYFVFFTSYSCLIFHFKILSPLTKGYDVALYGGDSEGFSTIFQTVHSTAILLTFSLCYLIYELFYFNKKMSLLTKFHYILNLLILFYSVYLTYVRTALLILVTGLFFIFIYKQKIKNLGRIITVFTIIGFFFLFKFNTDEGFRNRLIGKTIYDDKKVVDTNTISSGRLKIWETSFKSWSENNNILEILLGIGENELMERNNKYIGFRVFSHNGFIDILVQNGLISFLFYIMFLFNFNKNIKHPFIKEGKLIIIAFFYMYLTMMFVQGGQEVYTMLLINLVLLAFGITKTKYNINKV
ncbi:O-antigen ligase family protein [Polaribacter sp. BAL334]|uniref:O-antigen ligase family protein n=1 Tax=Polaribacter sp. BAL334 TaxID=1708178 RepID=UPI0018D267A0|nr:O-antigen ligase family protein [Polaribacter sp. BAL334]MBG7611724.1 O-antigen ligase family protein [Polaribacter sp. BAL334]